MTIGEIANLVNREGQTKEAQVRALRKIRCQLLEELHHKQQLLDQIDYMIYKIKKGGTSHEGTGTRYDF